MSEENPATAKHEHIVAPTKQPRHGWPVSIPILVTLLGMLVVLAAAILIFQVF